MSVELIKLNPFNNVVANGGFNVDLSNLFGYSVERIYLQLGGTFTKSMITQLQLKANGKTILDTDGAKMDARMQYRAITANAAFLTIDLLELKGRTKLAMMGGALDTTVGIKNLKLEGTITGATTPTLAGFAELSKPQVTQDFAMLRPLVARVHRVTQSIGGAGQFPLSIPHFDPMMGGSLYKRICIFSANLTALQMFRNGILEHDSIKALNDFRQVEYGRVTQTGLYVFDPIVDNLQEDRVFDTRPAAGCTTAMAYGTFSGAETITIEVETLEPIDIY